MIKVDYKFEYTCDCAVERYPVIIVAAGTSSRMQGINKQFLEVGGVPVIARTMLAFEESPLISRIILVTKEEFIADIEKLAKEYSIAKLTDVVCGGADRFSSVLNGFKCLDSNEKKVLIHDGARPFVDSVIIGNVCAALQNFDASVCAVPVKDTIKISSDDGLVENTPDRSKMYSAQTPQGVDVSLYKTAAETISNTSLITDDASVMELAGHKVKIVMGDYKNIKITTPEDIILAEAILKRSSV